MTALLDTGFLLAVLDADDEFHKVCTEVLLSEPQPLLPDVILSELAFMILRELGIGDRGRSNRGEVVPGEAFVK